MSSDEIELMITSVKQEEMSPENHQGREESDSHSDDISTRIVADTPQRRADRRYKQRKRELRPPKPQAKTAAERSKAYRERQKLRRSAAAEAKPPAPISFKIPKIVPNSACTVNFWSPNDGPEAAQIHNQHSMPKPHNIHQNSKGQQRSRKLQKIKDGDK